MIFTHDLFEERTCQMNQLMIYQHETMMVMGYNELIYGYFIIFPSFLKFSLKIIICIFDNLNLICISDDVITGLYLNFNLVPNLVGYVK